MKKFTKGCLITALVLFIIGCVMCGVFGLLGGYRQLEQMDGIAGMPWEIHFFDDNGLFYITGADYDDWDVDYDDWDSVTPAEGAAETPLDIRADELRNIDIEMGACALFIEESEDDNIWISRNEKAKNIYYRVSGDTLEIGNKVRRRWWRNTNVTDAVVVLYLPPMVLDTVEIEFGAGKIDAIPLCANTISIEIGAGKCDFEEVQASSVELTVGAGEMKVDRLYAREADIEAGAGELEVADMEVSGYMDLEIGMGNAQLNGKITGGMDADCGMGNLTMSLDGSETEHNYEIECAMGSVNIGNNSYSGLASEKYINNNSDSVFAIDCAMGSIDIDFRN